LAGPAVRHLAGRIDWDLFPPGEATLLLAVSGGADSVFLVRALAWRARGRDWSLLIAHVHHGIRGEEADADQQFVENLARDLRLEHMTCRLEPAQVESVSEDEDPAEIQGAGSSLEGRLRMARWGVLAALARARVCTAIVTGHHRDDLAETFLLQALRGAGFTGLGSMGPRGSWEDIDVIRPCLSIGREEIRSALQADGYSWREDRSNLDRTYKRNWLRLDVLPAIEARQQGSTAALARTARVCAEESAELQRQGRRVLAAARPPIELPPIGTASAIQWQVLRMAPPVLRHHALRLWIQELTATSLSPSFDAVHDLERAADSASGHGGEAFIDSIPRILAWTDGRFLVAGTSHDHAALDTDAMRLRITPWLAAWRRLWTLPLLFDRPDAPPVELLPVDIISHSVNTTDSTAKRRRTRIDPAGADRNRETVEIQVPINASGKLLLRVGTSARLLPSDWVREWDDDFRTQRLAVLNPAELQGPLVVRPPHVDERLEMKGGGHKEIAQALAEGGIPRCLRDRVPVVCDARGALWIPGIRRSARAWVDASAPIAILVTIETPEPTNVPG